MAGLELKRTSLMDADTTPKAGKSKGGGGGGGGSMDAQDRMKLIAAVVVILAAVIGLAAYYGVFSGSPKALPTVVQETLSPEQKKEAEELQKENEERIEEMIESGEAEKATAG